MNSSYDTRIAQHYSRRAKIYDRRWRGYIERTLRGTLDALSLSGSEHLLDVACGTGEFERMALARFPDLTIVGIDATQAMLDIAREKLAHCPNASFQLGEAERLPFDQAAFDAVVSANALHHLQKPEQVLRECARVLRPDGKLVLVDWCRDFWHCRLFHYWTKLTNPTYVRMYRVRQMATMLGSCGFLIHQTRRFIAPPFYGMMSVAARKS